MTTQRIWISKNSTVIERGLLTRSFYPVLGTLLCVVAFLTGCASSGSSQVTAAASQPSRSYSHEVQKSVSDTPDSVTGFLNSEEASGAAEYIQLGRESFHDSAWFDASEYFDSAMVHLTAMQSNDSLTPEIKAQARVYQDSVREWLVQSVTQASKLGEADDLSDLLTQEIEEVPDSALKNLEESLKALPDQGFDLPLPSPVPKPVLQALRVFTGQGRGYFTRWLQRRNRYDSLISAKLLERGMPQDLLYLSMVESGFNLKAWSHASASGLWQFMGGTGRRYGLKNDWWEDPRRDPVRATDAALDYLQDLYAEFNDWNLAMAAYNCGEGRIEKKLAKNPDQNYWNMSLPEETRLYVPKIMAAMIIGHNPAFFGFKAGEGAEPRLRFDTVTVSKPLVLKSIASVLEIREDSLRDLNPNLRRWCTPPGTKNYVLYLPPGTRDDFYENCAQMQTATTTAFKKHIVGRKESLAHIASRYGVTVASLQEANQLDGLKVHRGQILVIPMATAIHSSAPTASKHVATTATRYKVHKGETVYDIARRYQVSVTSLRDANNLGHSSLLRAGKVLRIPVKTAADTEDNAVRPHVVTLNKVHVVRRGETLASIARKLGVKTDELQRWNGLQSVAVATGQKLVYHPSRAVTD